MVVVDACSDCTPAVRSKRALGRHVPSLPAHQLLPLLACLPPSLGFYPQVFGELASLRRLDLEGCTASRAGSWLSRVLAGGAGSSDSVAMPPGLTELHAMQTNAFDKVKGGGGECL